MALKFIWEFFKYIFGNASERRKKNPSQREGFFIIDVIKLDDSLLAYQLVGKVNFNLAK